MSDHPRETCPNHQKPFRYLATDPIQQRLVYECPENGCGFQLLTPIHPPIDHANDQPNP